MIWRDGRVATVTTGSTANRGNNHLMGGAMPDDVMGGDGDDDIDAGAGHAMIEGGEGNDTIRGGTGADAFIVGPDSGFDRVLDFEAIGLAQGAFDHLALMHILPAQVSVEATSVGALVAWNCSKVSPWPTCDRAISCSSRRRASSRVSRTSGRISSSSDLNDRARRRLRSAGPGVSRPCRRGHGAASRCDRMRVVRQLFRPVALAQTRTPCIRR